jgi:hypothetical protein
VKAADFQDKLALFLTEFSELMPILDVEAGDDGVLRQWRGIEDPSVGNVFLQLEKVTFAELLSPEFPQRSQPEQGKPHFLLEERFQRRVTRSPPRAASSTTIDAEGILGRSNSSKNR